MTFTLAWRDLVRTASSLASYDDSGSGGTNVGISSGDPNKVKGDPDVGDRFNSSASGGNYNAFRIDFGSTVNLDVVALLGVRINPASWYQGVSGFIFPACTFRLQFQNAFGSITNTTTITVGPEAAIPGRPVDLYSVESATRSARYLIVGWADQTLDAAPFISRVWAGAALRLGATLQKNWRLRIADRGVVLRSKTGVTFPSSRGIVRTFEGTLLGLTDDQAQGTNTYAGGVTEGMVDFIAYARDGRRFLTIPRRPEAAIYGTADKARLPRLTRSRIGGGWDCGIVASQPR